MILYKYVDFDTGMKIIHQPSLAFTKYTFLNDPFETRAGTHPGELENIFLRFDRHTAVDSNYPILSLTRTPLNSIMWSHYAAGHSGFVFGIDTERAGIDDESSCTLPAKYGSIIYTASKPIGTYKSSEEASVIYGFLRSFDSRHLEAMQRIFLYKSSEWHYEEEVRAVMTSSSLIEKKAIPLTYGNSSLVTRFLLPIPYDALKTIHIGYRTFVDDFDQTLQLVSTIRQKLPSTNLFTCTPSEQTWRLEETPLLNGELDVHEFFYPSDN